MYGNIYSSKLLSDIRTTALFDKHTLDVACINGQSGVDESDSAISQVKINALINKYIATKDLLYEQSKNTKQTNTSFIQKLNSSHEFYGLNLGCNKNQESDIPSSEKGQVSGQLGATLRVNSRQHFDNIATSAMSRRKQHKPRHLDENEDITPRNTTEPNSAPQSTLEERQQEKNPANCDVIDSCAQYEQNDNPDRKVSGGSVEMPCIGNGNMLECSPTASSSGEAQDITPPGQGTRLAPHSATFSSTPYATYLPQRNASAVDDENQREIPPLNLLSPYSDTSKLNGLHHAYFRGLSTASNASHSDDDIPSDIESNEPSEHLPIDSSENVKETSESGFVEGSSSVKGQQTYEEHTDSNRSGHSGSGEDIGDEQEQSETTDSATVCGVKLKTLNTTNVAVAQVVDAELMENAETIEEEEDDDDDDEGEDVEDGDCDATRNAPAIPEIQQVLFTLHQQQMFQLHILQQMQQHIAKFARGGLPNNESHDGNPAGFDMAAMTSAMLGFPWLRNGFPAPSSTGAMMEGAGMTGQYGSTGASSGAADDLSDTSGASLAGNEEDFGEEGRIDDDVTSNDKYAEEGKENRPEIAQSPSAQAVDKRSEDLGASTALKPAFPPFSIDRPENGKGLPTSSPGLAPGQSPGPVRSALSSFMPGFNPFSPASAAAAANNPLLPSNLFTAAPMPFFRPYFPPPPPQDDEDSMEEFMEIEKIESSKLDELVKKMEPTLKDPNQCAICKRILSCKSALQMHYRTHTGERPFKCKICGRAFTTKGNLKTHMSVHRTRPSGQMHHSCPVCSKHFTNPLLLQEHLRIHVGEMNRNGFPPKSLPFLPLLPPNYLMSFPPMMMPQHKLPPSSASEPSLLRTPSESYLPRQEAISPVSYSNHTRDESEERASKRSVLEDDEAEFEVKKHKVENNRPEVKSPVSTNMVDVYTPNGKRPELSPEKNGILHTSDSFNEEGGSLFALQKHVKEMDKLIQNQTHPMGLMDPFRFGAHHFIPSKEAHLNRESNFEGSEYKGSRDEPHTPNSSVPPIKIEPQSTSAHTSVITHSSNGLLATPSHHMPRPLLRTASTPSRSPPACPSSPFRKKESLRHVCGVCHKPFSSGSALQIHMRTHTGERPFKCHVCGKGFTTKGNLKVHMSTHACQTGPPRRGRRMSMDGMPPFGTPSSAKFPSLPPRPPMLPLGFPGSFPCSPAAFNSLMMQNAGKGLSSFMAPVFPGFGFDRHRPMGHKEGSLSPAVDNKKPSSDAVDNNNVQPKGIYGELDLSVRGAGQPIKT